MKRYLADMTKKSIETGECAVVRSDRILNHVWNEEIKWFNLQINARELCVTCISWIKKNL